MKDYFHQILKWISYNRGKVFGIVLACAMVVGLLSCQPKTISIIDPTKEITADQFHQEYNTEVSKVERELILLEQWSEELAVKYELGATDLDQQTKQIEQWLELGSGVVATALSGNPVAWTSVLPTAGLLLLSGLTAGSVFDQRKKDKVIKKQKVLLNGGNAKIT